jgi:formylglycine-generating enzyme required for sulfatase activity
VVYVSQSNAAHYCDSQGKRLPFEYEWEKAARGSQGPRIYPWGDSWDSSRANAAKTAPGPEPVNAYPNGCSSYGACNMSGNVAEWTGDFFNGNWYADRLVKSLLRDPIFWGPPAALFNVRGGSFKSSSSDARVSKRWGERGAKVMDDVGFRCVKPVE